MLSFTALFKCKSDRRGELTIYFVVIGQHICSRAHVLTSCIPNNDLPSGVGSRVVSLTLYVCPPILNFIFSLLICVVSYGYVCSTGFYWSFFLFYKLNHLNCLPNLLSKLFFFFSVFFQPISLDNESLTMVDQ